MTKRKEAKKSSKLLEYMLKNRGDCAEDVFKMAGTPWEKQVAVELFVNEQDHKLMEKDINHIKKMVWAIFAVVAITAVANFVSTYVFPLIGV